MSKSEPPDRSGRLRVALGAAPSHVMRLVMVQGMVQLGIGLSIGLALSLLLGRGLTLVLYQVSMVDPLVFGGIAAVLMITGLAAAYIPARRATRVDPLVAMRAD